MKLYVFLLLLIFSCKKNEAKVEIIPKDETLDLKYEVLNQLIENDSINSGRSRFIYSTGLMPTTINKDVKEIRPLGVDLTFDSIFLEKDSVFYYNQEKIDFKFKFDRSKIKSKLKYVTAEKILQMRQTTNREFWQEFYKRFDRKCLRTFSIPFFNKDKTICVIQNSTSCGILDAVSYTAIYKKVNGKWIEVRSYDHWVS